MLQILIEKEIMMIDAFLRQIPLQLYSNLIRILQWNAQVYKKV